MAETCKLRSMKGILEELEVCIEEKTSVPWKQGGTLGNKYDYRWEGVLNILVEEGIYVREGIGLLEAKQSIPIVAITSKGRTLGLCLPS